MVILTFIAFEGKTQDKTFHLVAGVYPPYTIEDGEVSGINIDIIKAAYTAVGYQLDIELLPFTRAMYYAKNGRADGLILWHNQQREQWFSFSSKITQSELVFYKKKQLGFEFLSLQSLASYSIGTVANYGYSKEFLAAKNLKKYVVGTDRQNLRKLIFGRIDLAIIDKRMAKYLIKKEYPKYLEKLDWSGVLQKENYYLAISKKSADYQQKIRDFNLGLQIITENGLRASILNNYQYVE